jgi:MFS family permease
MKPRDEEQIINENETRLEPIAPKTPIVEKFDTKIVLLSCIGMFITVLNFGIMNVALPPLQTLFHTTTSIISWTISIYVLLLSCTILLFGKLSDRYGKIRIYGYGFVVFFIGSLFCALAPNVGLLIAARGLQGIGAAMIQANAVALITSMLPEHKRVKALSLLGMAMGLGPILGPALGGVIVSIISWRWIFLINLPICIWGFIEAKTIKDNLLLAINEKLPTLQLGLFSLAIVSFLFGLFKVGDNNITATLLILATVILTAVYLFIEKRSKVNIVPPITIF